MLPRKRAKSASASGSSSSVCSTASARVVARGTSTDARTSRRATPSSRRAAVTAAMIVRSGDAGRRAQADAGAVCLERGVDALDHPDDVEAEHARGPRRVTGDDRMAEVAELEQQRLGSVDARRDDVAGAV